MRFFYFEHRLKFQKATLRWNGAKIWRWFWGNLQKEINTELSCSRILRSSKSRSLKISTIFSTQERYTSNIIERWACKLLQSLLFCNWIFAQRCRFVLSIGVLSFGRYLVIAHLFVKISRPGDSEWTFLPKVEKSR